MLLTNIEICLSKEPKNVSATKWPLTLYMTCEGLGEMFEGDSAETCARKFPLMLMGGRANGPACADGERGPPSA